MEPDLSLLHYLCFFPTFCFFVANSKGSVLADPNKCFYFKTFILLLQESSLLPLEQEKEMHLHSMNFFTGGQRLL